MHFRNPTKSMPAQGQVRIYNWVKSRKTLKSLYLAMRGEICHESYVSMAIEYAKSLASSSLLFRVIMQKEIVFVTKQTQNSI